MQLTTHLHQRPPPWRGTPLPLHLRRYSKTTQRRRHASTMTVLAVQGMVLPLLKHDIIQFYLKLFSLCLTTGSLQSCDQPSSKYVSMERHRRVGSVYSKSAVPGIKICSRTGIQTESFRGSPLPIQPNARKGSQIRPKQYAFIFSPIYCSLISYHSTPYILPLKPFVKRNDS